MSSASPPSLPTASLASASSPLERRLNSEWDLLRRLADRNPHRLQNLRVDDLSFRLRLLETSALALPSEHTAEQKEVVTEHDMIIVFPRFFPAAPLELYLSVPMQHPNIHPETGFVCLWDRHRVSHTVEHALHKLVAILGWTLYNRDSLHVMQSEALALMDNSGAAVTALLGTSPLLGVAPDDLSPVPVRVRPDQATRRRLS